MRRDGEGGGSVRETAWPIGGDVGLVGVGAESKDGWLRTERGAVVAVVMKYYGRICVR